MKEVIIEYHSDMNEYIVPGPGGTIEETAFTEELDDAIDTCLYMWRKDYPSPFQIYIKTEEYCLQLTTEPGFENEED